MTIDKTAFPITIVSTDRAALRELSWTLEALGFNSTSSSDWGKSAMWRLLDRPSLLLVDARDQEQLQQLLESPHAQVYRYTMAFHDSISAAEVAKLMDAGIEDVVGLPGNPGELLTRIQSGLRRIEFENRLSENSSWDAKSGMTTGKGFARQLQRRIDDRTGTTDSVVIALSIDQQDTLGTQFGSLVSGMANETLARCLVDQTAEEDFFAFLDDGVFLVFLEKSAVREGIQFAELIVKEFKAQNVLSPEFNARITVSGTVLSVSPQDPAGQIVQRALKAFGQVRDSGGNLIIDAFAMEQSFSMWERRATGTSPTSGMTAKHVMESIPFLLSADERQTSDSSSLGMFSLHSESPQAPCAVAVDRQGRFLGLVQQSYFAAAHHDSDVSIEEYLVHTSATVDTNQPVTGCCELLEEAESDCLVVLDSEKPVGYITREKLSAIDGFTVTETDSEPKYDAKYELESLVVPA